MLLGKRPACHTKSSLSGQRTKRKGLQMVKNPPQINLDKVRLKVLKPTEKGWTQQIVNVVVGRKRIGDIELSLYKEKHTVYIEWMEIYEQHRCAGAGSAAYRLLETYIRKAYYWCK